MIVSELVLYIAVTPCYLNMMKADRQVVKADRGRLLIRLERRKVGPL